VCLCVFGFGFFLAFLEFRLFISHFLSPQASSLVLGVLGFDFFRAGRGKGSLLEDFGGSLSVSRSRIGFEVIMGPVACLKSVVPQVHTHRSFHAEDISSVAVVPGAKNVVL
jgi:hypothetical protein